MAVLGGGGGRRYWEGQYWGGDDCIFDLQKLSFLFSSTLIINLFFSPHFTLDIEARAPYHEVSDGRYGGPLTVRYF